MLDHHPILAPHDEADLWERFAIESYTIGAPAADTVAAQQRAVDLRRGDDPRACGTSLRWLSRICWWAGDPDGATAAADEAVKVLVTAGDDDLLAMALSNKAQLHALSGRDAEAIEMAEQAITLGRDSPATLSHALNNLGLARHRLGDPRAFAILEQSLRVALDADEPEHACRSYANLIWHCLAELRHDDARRLLVEGIELADRSKFLMYSRYLQVALASLHFATGAWDEVVPTAV